MRGEDGGVQVYAFGGAIERVKDKGILGGAGWERGWSGGEAGEAEGF